LIIDLDPQGNSSTGLGIQNDRRKFTTFELLVEDVDLDSIVLETDVENLFIVPATVDLSSADIELYTDEQRVFKLREALNKPSMNKFGFDFILIDCPPSLNLLTINAMVASNSVLIPLQVNSLLSKGCHS
jgi:chromosome partitioning protein